MDIGYRPSNTTLAGYSFLITEYNLAVPLPDLLFSIGEKHVKLTDQRWKILTPRYQPAETLFAHLTFALKNEGIFLWVLKALFQKIDPQTIEEIVLNEPTSIYSRKIWFLYEWLLEHQLNLEDLHQGNYTDLVNSKLQYPGPSKKIRRQRIRNNLPGNIHFCPLIRRTEKLDSLIEKDLQALASEYIKACHSDVLSRAASFLLLADSKASYVIEGEKPPHTRIERWGRIIGQAGQTQLSLNELERLQNIVIADNRFVMPGLRLEGGFIGLHDRVTGMPLPEHISAKPDDLELLINGLLKAYALLINSDYPPVLLAASLAFGFVFIHPFEDGNGRLHRYLFHHILAETGFVKKGLVFPVSTVILERIDRYREILQNYSNPRLAFIDWHQTLNNNVEVVNETVDLYRYFDATLQAEFLYECVDYTVEVSLPKEVDYLNKRDLFVSGINLILELPDRMMDLLIRFLEQNNGQLSKRALEKEFESLTQAEVELIEQKYAECFGR